MTKRILLLLLPAVLLFVMSAPAQDPSSIAGPEKSAATDKAPAGAGQGQVGPAESDEAQTAALAKAAQNPIASLISVPFQNNTSFGVGPYNRDQNLLNIQPVIPVRISENWNLINRIIQPILWQPNTQQPSQGMVRPGRHEPHLLPFAGAATQTDLGHWADFCDSHGHRRSAWPGEVQHGPGRCPTDHSRTLGHRHAD